MSMAITTRYFGPSNARGSRIKALARKAETWGDVRNKEMSLTDSWNHAASVEENHCRVAQCLAAKLNWAGVWVAGSLPDGRGNVFVCVADGRDAETLAMALRAAAKRQGRDFFIINPKEAE